MDFFEVIDKRRTLRDLQDKEVPMEVIEKLLTAGLKAPTNDHMRSWEFVMINDPEEKAKIINKIPKNLGTKQAVNFVESYQMDDPCQREMYIDAIPKQYGMLYHSGCLILPFFKQESPLLKPDSLSALNGFASIWCCIENILLAATAEGLGAAFRIPFDKEAKYLREAVGHPDNYIMPCYISIGYPAENAVKHVQHDFDAKDKIHMNKW